jgi:hypothetical protein
MMTANPARSCGLILVVAILGTAATSLAQPVVSAKPGGSQDGESIGILSIGGGVTSMDTTGADARLGGGLAMTAGIRLRPRLALVFDAGLIAQSEGMNDSVRRGGTLTVGLQYWPWSRLWLRGSAGAGWLHHTGGTDDAYHRDGLAPAALVAAGVELLRHPSWSLDLQIRSAALLHYGQSVVLTNGLLAGVSWR